MQSWLRPGGRGLCLVEAREALPRAGSHCQGSTVTPMADYVQGKTCNSEYEELVGEIARQEVGSEVSLLAVTTYPDSIVYEMATNNGAWVFKALEPHGRDRDAIALEAWSYERSREARIPTPRILSLDTSCARFPSSFLIMEKMKGECLEGLELPPRDLEQALKELGSLMRALHEIEMPRFGLLDEAHYRATEVVQGSADSWNDALFGAAEESLKYLAREALTSSEVERVRYLAERESRLVDLRPTGGRLLHGDLGLVHVWFDPEKGAISGVIDFGECMSGDPVYDFCDFDLQPHLLAHVITGYYYGETPPPDLHSRIWRYAFARSIPWAAKWYERGHMHVIDWVRRLLEMAPKTQ